MSSEPSLLPRKWFAATAALSLLLAGLAAFLLFGPHPRRAAMGPPLPTHSGLRQRGEDGLLIPWGTTISGTSVRIEVVGVDPQRVKEIELLLSRDGAPPVRLDHVGAGADLQQLAPGRYRWNAVVHLGTDVPMLLEPPRGDPLAADFVVSPLVLELPPLRQRTLQGNERIESGGPTKGGAKLGTEFASPLPGAVLEIEATPAATAFNGLGVQRIPVHEGDVSVDFAAPNGAYHWRARLVAAARSQTDWRDFGTGPGGDFVIFAAPPKHSTQKNSDSDGGHDVDSDATDNDSDAGKNSGTPPGNGKPNPTNKNQGAGKNSGNPAGSDDPEQTDKDQDAKQNPGGEGKGTTSAKSYSSGMGSGYRGPLPSRLRPLASLWHLAFLRMGLIFGGIIAALGVILISIQVIRGVRHRGASVS